MIMSSIKNINILDCTLRDGGYYNQWNFDSKLVKEYITSIKDSKIQIIEIGFRFLSNSKLYGPFAYSKDSLLSKLKFPNTTKISVMLNASDFDKKNYKKQISKLFKKDSIKYISIVRIACKQDEIPLAINLSKLLNNYGYEVFINLMQINLIEENELIKILKKLYHNKKTISCFYFADSFGSLVPSETKKYCKLISKYWKNKFGIHTHDNCGLALKNTIEALKNGATYLDGTIAGMGRGAGNVSTEDILRVLINKYKLNFKNKKILELKKNFFLPLKNKYNWGKSIFYKLAAKKNIHPTFVQSILLDKKFDNKQVFQIINNLKKFKSNSYNESLLKKSFLINNDISKLSYLKKNLYKKKILIVTNTLNTKRSKTIIENYKFKKNYKVLSINSNKFYDNEIIDFYITNNYKRILLEKKHYKRNSKIIMPTQFSYLFKDLKKIELFNFDTEIVENNFNYKNGNCQIPFDISIAYILCLINLLKVKKICLIGFDGYQSEDYLQYQMENFLKIYNKNSRIKLNFLTSSSYNNR